MKTLSVVLLVLIVMSGQLNADNPSAANNKITLNLDDTSEILVTGYIAPVEYTGSNFHVEWDELANLRVAKPEKRYQASVFRAFLPDKAVSIGDLWRIEEEGALELLKQLHPNPSLKMHINMGDSRGLWACLRAYNDQYADIVFRIHSEFVLENGWFTPSQFTGHLVVDRIKKEIVFFEMYVPEGVLNFDVNWKRFGGRITDSGFCPQIRLRAGTQDVLESIGFAESITEETAVRALILRFYKSQQINWVSLEEALKMAPTQQKPVHVLSIDGPLADESC